MYYFLKDKTIAEKLAYVTGYREGVCATIDALDSAPTELLRNLADMMEDVKDSEANDAEAEAAALPC